MIGFFDFRFGGTGWVDQPNLPSVGSTFSVPVGLYLLTISGEAVEVKAGSSTISAGQGTALAAGTTLLVFSKGEQWAARSAGGAGRLTLTPVTADSQYLADPRTLR